MYMSIIHSNEQYKIQKYTDKLTSKHTEKHNMYNKKLYYYLNNNIVGGSTHKNYSVTLLYINQKTQHIDDMVFNELQNLLSCLVKHENKNIHFYIDYKYILETDIKKFSDIVTKYNDTNYIKIINLRDMFLEEWSFGFACKSSQLDMFGTQLENLFADTMNIYARVDFGKILIFAYEMEIFYRNNRPDELMYIVYCDLAVTDSSYDNGGIVELSEKYFFGEKTMALLKPVGFLMGLDVSRCENRFILLGSYQHIKKSLFMGIRDISRHLTIIQKKYMEYKKEHTNSSAILLTDAKLRNFGFMWFIGLNDYANFFIGNLQITRYDVILSTDICELLEQIKPEKYLLNIEIEWLESCRSGIEYSLLFVLTNNVMIGEHITIKTLEKYNTRHCINVDKLSNHSSLSTEYGGF